MDERMLVVASARFESARHLGSDARALHGHSFGARARVLLGTAPGESPGWFAFPGGEIDALRQRLQTAVAPLDYRLLNDHVPEPSDVAIARWIRARLDLPETAGVGVRSAHARGVEIDRAGDALVWHRYDFESAHVLPKVRPGHKCGRMHGHGFAAVLRVASSSPDSQTTEGLHRAWEPLSGQLHLACLNEIPGLENPTSENLARWIWDRLRPQLADLRFVTVYETSTCGAHYDGRDFRIWKEMEFDSAVHLRNAPAGDARRALHGHSYRVRLHLRAPLDEVLGWTLDFGDVKEVFTPVFLRLDHNPLHELPGIAQGGSPALARWIRGEVSPHLPQLERVDVFETPGCGVELHWDPA